MKTTVKLLIVAVLMISIFSQGTSASAGGGGGDISFRFKGLGASAQFSSVDPSGCVYTDVYIWTSEQMILNQPGPNGPFSAVSLSMSQYDACTGTQVLAADGYAALAESDLQVSRRLDSASLTTTANLYDYVSGNSFDVFIDLNWTAVSPRGRQSNQSQYKMAGCHIKYQDSSAFRIAQASGSISDGGTEYAPASSAYAQIFSSKGGSVVHGCN